MTRRDASALCAFGLTGGWLRGQEHASGSGSATVNVDVIVRSPAGDLVRDLGIADFTLADSYQPQTIQSFSREIDAPLTIGLLMDTNASARRMTFSKRFFVRRNKTAPSSSSSALMWICGNT